MYEVKIAAWSTALARLRLLRSRASTKPRPMASPTTPAEYCAVLTMTSRNSTDISSP